ncbi:FecR family protein [Parabacteroides sp. GYB001]|uniref:FecR family protein n=1 Tax=Parabacteroides leei TaxID=2939491 RepID=UPI0020178241|nr:FecR family protein [Parabacteroides leei]MCL3852641.1 FecR family protein [Parabacteroides leei]
MKENNNTKQLMRLYFGKHFSRYGCILFGRWLKADDEKIQKEEMLQELWEKSRSEVTASTYNDWEVLRKHLFVSSVTWKRSASLPRKLLKYVAAVVLMLVTVLTTYWLTESFKPTRHLEMTEVFVPYGESKQVMLPDGSSVWVDAGSLLVYPKDFTNTDTRTVYLTGEAAFSVHKNSEQPFIVKTTYLDVQALGTVFTVEAYPNDTCSTATLEQGSVLVAVKKGNIQPTILRPDQQLIYSHVAHTVRVQSVDISLYQKERSGYLIFENASFNHLMTSLERKFNVTIHYNSHKYASEYYNVKFSPDEELEDVLTILQQLVGIRYKVKGNVVFIN